VAIYRLGNDAPTIHESAFVAESATVIGKVTLKENVSVWPGAVLRGDNEPIVIDAGSNIQEGAVLHTDPGFPLHVEENVTVGHLVMLHGCTIGKGSLVGIQAVVLNGAVIGRDSLVGAGSLVTENKTFPDQSLILGSPAKAVRQLNEQDLKRVGMATSSYIERRKQYKESLVRIG
jgi:carbonic anhydrase/acetyltransferase-like protein (isoleucine patch superfamily)